MSSREKLLFERFLKAEALFKTNDGLLIAQPDVSRQQYYNIEYDHSEHDSYHHKLNHKHKQTPTYQKRNSTTNINTSILTQLWNEEDSAISSNDGDSTDSTVSSDDDDDFDWKCCAHNISFLNDYDNDTKITDDGPIHNINTNHKSNNGLDAFLSDVLEETYHRKRNEAMHKKQHNIKSSFSSSHHTKLCQRCCHIFLNPKTRLNQILQLYHVERRLNTQQMDQDIKQDYNNIETRSISHAIFHPSVTTQLFDFTEKGHIQYRYKYVRKHINLPNIYQIYNNCIISDHSLITLSTINRFNRAILGSQYRKLFILYQLLQLFAFTHNEYNIVHGNLTPSLICIDPHNLLITVTGWFTNHYHHDNMDRDNMDRDSVDNDKKEDIDLEELLERTNIPKTPWIKPIHNTNDVDKYKQRIICQSELLRSVIYRWIHREISNFEYIMELNNLCGRMKGDPFNHPVLPWVVDFTSPDGITDIGWRDLGQSKFRLTKGDHQIDHTFLFSPQPHHVTEVLSSLTYFLYLARRTPQYILQKAVRSRFEPKEYPVSMNKLYQCVPEECIPEFYCDSTIFESIIEALPNLQIPSWCHSPSHFIEWHRQKLESKQVSSSLHLWIDLNFGYRLGQDSLNNDNRYIFGYNDSSPCISRIEAAINCKNIPLQFDPLLARHCGVVQLFNQPHPPQIGPHNKIYNPLLDSNYLSHQQSLQIQRRIVEFGNEFLKLYSCTISPQSLGFVLSDKDNTLTLHRHNNNNIMNILKTTIKPRTDDITETDSISNDDNDRMRSKSQQITARRHRTLTSKKSMTSSLNDNQNMSYFAYDASGHGYVGYLNEDSRKRVGIVSPGRHYACYADDIFSLGCIMASIFTGKSLFCYNSLKKHLLGIDVLSGSLCKLPPVVSSCIGAMVNRDPSLRPNINCVLNWDSLFVYGMKEMYDLIQYIHEWLSIYSNKMYDLSISCAYIDLLSYITSSLLSLPEMHPELFALIVPYLIDDIPIWSECAESLLYYFKMVWCISSKLSEELCCYLLKKPFLCLLSLCQKSHEYKLMMELLKPNTANFIRNHFGEYNFSKYYMKTIRSSLKSSNIEIRKTAEIFLISMNKFMELKLISNSIIDPILNDLNNNVSLNPQEIRSFMMITQSRGEIFITKHVIPAMLNIINDKILNHDKSLYVIFAILELLIYLLKPHRNRKFVFQTGLKFTDNTAIFKCLRLPLNGKYFDLIEFKKLILLVIRIAQFFGPKSEITQSLLKTLEPMMIKLKERVLYSPCDSFNVYTSNDCRELLFMIYTSFQSIFSEKQLDAELDQIELKSSKQIKRIVLHYMEQRRSINNSKYTVSLKDHSPPILEPSTWKINVHSSFYQQLIDDDDDCYNETDNETDNETENETDNEEEELDGDYSKQWQFKANIHHIIQGHQPSTRILTIESKKNANLVLTGGSEGNIRMWRVEYSKLRDLTQYTQHLGAIKNISFLKYTDQIASCCGEIHVWDSAKCETIRKFSPRYESPPSSRYHHHKSQSVNLDLHHDSFVIDHNKTLDKYTTMTPFNYCCLLAGNEKGRIEFLDINTRSCSYDWEILPHSKLNLSKMDNNNIREMDSNSIRRITAISVRNNQREVAVGLSDGQIVILDLRNGFIVESFHEFCCEITKLYWSSDNILIALCRDEGLYVFNCNQISRLYLESCSKFASYPKDKLYKLKNINKNKKSKLVTIQNGANENENDNNDAIQISKKLCEIGDATNDNNNDDDDDDIMHDTDVYFDHDEPFETQIINKKNKLRKKDVVIRTLLLNPNFNGDIDDYSRYTEHIRAYHCYINNNNCIASNGMEQIKCNSNPIIINPEIDIHNCNNLLPFTPIISKPFLFNSTPEIIAKYNPAKFDPKSLRTIKTNLSQYKITDFGLYKSNIICSIGKGIGYAKLKTPIQRLKEPIYNEENTIYNSKMITRSFPSLKTKSSLSSLSILENMHLVILGTNNGKVFTCG